MKLLETGGADFIGTRFVNHWLNEHAEDSIVIVDCLTYVRFGRFLEFEIE